MIEFKETNKDQFSVQDSVTLMAKIKNVPEISLKVYEFNTETYYKKNLKPFDTSIDL